MGASYRKGLSSPRIESTGAMLLVLESAYSESEPESSPCGPWEGPSGH